MIPAIILVLGLASVAAFFLFAPGIVEAAKNRVIPHARYPVAERAHALHKRLVIGDWHCDSLLWNRNLLRRSRRGHVDFPRLREGNVAMQVFTTVTMAPAGINVEKNTAGTRDNVTLLAIAQLWPPRTWNSLLERGLYQAERMKRWETEAPNVVRILRTRADLADILEARAHGAETVGALVGAEGAHILEGKLENINVLWDAGFRLMGLHHFLDSELGGSLHGESGAGLTPYGRDVVTALVERGFIIDLTHSSLATAQDVLAMTDVPLVVSHTGICSHCQTPRNFPDELMVEICTRGGVAGIGYWQEVIGDTTPAGIASAVIAAIDLLGEDHVSLGSDFDGTAEEPFDTSELVVVTDALLKAQLPEAAVAKVMGGNMVRLLRRMLPRG